MKRSDFRYFHSLRVRWAEVDMQQIVFNAHYLMYLDTAIGGYWQALGMPYSAAMAQLQGDMFVKKASLEFHASAEYDDRLDIALRCENVGNSSMLFQGAIFRGDQCLITAELVYVFADPKAKASRPVPPPLRQALLDYEAGETMLHLAVGSWDEVGADAAIVRQAVFVTEQGIAREDEWDTLDADCQHAVVRNFLHMPLATGRLLPAVDGVSHIGRMAVLRSVRGVGLGDRVLSALLQRARERGDRRVVLHAQRSAEGFYAQAGFVVVGEPFEEVGIPHVQMALDL